MEVLNLRGLSAGGSTIYSRWAVCLEDPQISAFVLPLGETKLPREDCWGFMPRDNIPAAGTEGTQQGESHGSLSIHFIPLFSVQPPVLLPEVLQPTTPPLIQSFYCGERAAWLCWGRGRAGRGGVVDLGVSLLSKESWNHSLWFSRPHLTARGLWCCQFPSLWEILVSFLNFPTAGLGFSFPLSVVSLATFLTFQL